MNVNFLRPALALPWLAVAIAIFFRKPLGLEFLDDRWDDSTLTFGGIVALAFVLWNTFRWWAAARKSRADEAFIENPLKPRERNRHFEYNPELDFTRPGGDTSAK